MTDNVTGAGFVSDPLKAAADFMGNGAIEVAIYESEILDLVRRDSLLRQRIPAMPAKGHPHRYFEQTAIGAGTFTDPRSISPTPSSPTRVERAAMIKALTNQINLSLFDVQVTKQQGLFPGLDAKDVVDCVNGVIMLAAGAYWTGTDTSLSSPTTTQYVGLLTQITLQATIAPGYSIVDGIKTQIASMLSSLTLKVRPTAIYVSPALGNYIDQECKSNNITMGTTVIGGVTVNTINTQAGMLPLITEVQLVASAGSAYGFSAPPTGNKNHYAVILTESLIERPFVDGGNGNSSPQLFRLGLGSGLAGQYVCVQFDAIIAKAATYAHSVIAVQRP